LTWVMTEKTAVERIGSAVVATYVQIGSTEPRGGGREGKLTPEMITDFAGKAEGSISESGVSFLPWRSGLMGLGTRRTLGPPRAIPRRSGWPSRPKVTLRTIGHVCIRSLHHGFLPLRCRRWSLVDQLQGLQDRPCVGTAPG